MKKLRSDAELFLKSVYGEKEVEYLAIINGMINYVSEKILNKRNELDKNASISRDFLNDVFKFGFQTIPYSKEYGGYELPYLLYIIGMEVLAYGSPSVANVVWASNSVIDGLHNFGSNFQKELYLKPLLKGDKIAAIAMTEPSGGSLIEYIKTRAERKGNRYILNGSKIFITNAPIADIFLVFANTDKGISAFILDNNTEGLKIGKSMHKLGLRGAVFSEVTFDNCIVPEENILGEEGDGLNIAKHIFIGGRVIASALALGIGDAVLDQISQYVTSRELGKYKLIDFQLIKGKIAEMETILQVGKIYTYYTAFLMDKIPRQELSESASISKLFTTESALKMANDAISIFGGYGYTDDLNIHMFWRDARGLTIVEGTSDIQRLIIQHELKKRMQ
ncbi:Acyl-CoA dehydrogenase [Saccharolobus shibatae B12]|uniref:Acyl-CoA dehydrogenase n=1 Tax=Saccharolobus shibatae (strain ATCC 51178 / DSM 5389 / JCM 8931 / NBRC 15437 / B12) TaxID=523848 RepID=A0A8F5BLW4_SACSH|nr:acyl-CoA dehydrogenase family protein [Saccharolobus shibatae]QXJ27563.1 Acyl-CoA dehydrogenase [Saccharolobus shibatae B12]